MLVIGYSYMCMVRAWIKHAYKYNEENETANTAVWDNAYHTDKF